ncbi:subtilase family protein [Stackebrandtia albiflava]|uniref:Subtilase family protein n=1 Tax=Stackebrandtia albiflava TaxID=406432 RepID=A0A562V4L3_9ACTN|nr:S8 family serine peptidase [Stackebrandtia albiflava]TWJ12772.1 subtilase family protein [Stackebrandtia albiflava]
MKIVFTDESASLEPPNPRRDRSSGVPSLPEHVLDRHRARVLRPGDAPVAAGTPTPDGTVYRYQRLLMCHRLLGDTGRLAALDDVLTGHGLRIDRSRIADRPAARMHRAELGAAGTRPTRVDAWTVLQTVRAAVENGDCDRGVGNGLRLEHLLVAAKGGGPSAGTPGGGGPGGPYPSYPDRFPVEFAAPMPTRRPVAAMPGGRRPVIAVLDTGIAPGHPALDVSDRSEGRDTFVSVDTELQKTITIDSDPEGPPLDTPWDTLVTDESLLGEVSSHFGHGTFIAGLIRQIAPDARVRSIRVMHDDGLVYEHECIHALSLLADEVERARAGDESADPVDLITLSFGFVDEDPYDQPSAGLMRVVERLARLGVGVVAAAGNQATRRPFYPAALAAEDLGESAAPILSVAALNPNGTVAMFSNEGSWVNCYATGAGLVSTFPTFASGSRSPDRQSAGLRRRREGFDADDFSSGFAVWNGTSFAAPVAAAGVTAAMLRLPGVDLSDRSAEAAAGRLTGAIRVLKG